MKKNVAVIIRQTPFNTIQNKEGLRMCVGATLRENTVTVIFMGPGVISAGKIRPEIIGAPVLKSEFEAFSLLKMKRIADRRAVEQYKIVLQEDIMTASLEDIAEVLVNSDVVISW